MEFNGFRGRYFTKYYFPLAKAPSLQSTIQKSIQTTYSPTTTLIINSFACKCHKLLNSLSVGISDSIQQFCSFSSESCVVMRYLCTYKVCYIYSKRDKIIFCDTFNKQTRTLSVDFRLVSYLTIVVSLLFKTLQLSVMKYESILGRK